MGGGNWYHFVMQVTGKEYSSPPPPIMLQIIRHSAFESCKGSI